MAAALKQLLPNVETELYYNWNDLPGSKIKAVNITLCNTSASDVDVWLSFCIISGVFSAGLVLSKMTIPANETITTEITERIINVDESIRGFASVADVVALSIDLVGDIVQDELPTIEV